MWAGGHELGRLGLGGASSRSTPDSCVWTIDFTRSASIAGALTTSTIPLRSRPRSRNTRWSPNWRLPSTRHDPPPEALERDRRVDRDRRRPDAALGAVVGVDAAHRRPTHERLARREARDERLHAGEQLGRVERLDEVVVGARTQRTDLLLHVAVGREHDDRDVATGPFLGPDPCRDLEPVDAHGGGVEQDQRGRLLLPQREPLGASGRDEDLVPLLLEGVLEESLDARVVIDDEDLAGHPTSRIVATPWRARSPDPGGVVSSSIGRRSPRPRYVRVIANAARR